MASERISGSKSALTHAPFTQRESTVPISASADKFTFSLHCSPSDLASSVLRSSELALLFRKENTVKIALGGSLPGDAALDHEKKRNNIISILS
jgi:hypothetical protein